MELAQKGRRVERVIAYGARTSRSRADTPNSRVLRDLILPVVFKFLVTEQSLAWMYNHHVGWDTPLNLQAEGT
jgi:hypothetical protein